jgi:hypothetical protein
MDISDLSGPPQDGHGIVLLSLFWLIGQGRFLRCARCARCARRARCGQSAFLPARKAWFAEYWHPNCGKARLSPLVVTPLRPWPGLAQEGEAVVLSASAPS